MNFNNNNDDDDGDLFTSSLQENSISPDVVTAQVAELSREYSANNPGVDRVPPGYEGTPDSVTSEDPCVDPPDPPGGETDVPVFTDPDEEFLFPILDNTERSDIIIQNENIRRVYRRNLFISQQYYYDNNRRRGNHIVFGEGRSFRMTNGAFSSEENMNSRAPQILIDPFRYAAGLVYEHMDSTIIELPSGEQANAVVGSPQYIATTEQNWNGRTQTFVNDQKGIIISVEAGTRDNPRPFRQGGRGLDRNVLNSEISIRFSTDNLSFFDYYPDDAQEIAWFVSDAARQDEGAAQYFLDQYLMGNNASGHLINTDRANGDRFINLPFQDHTFSSPASFFDGEIDSRLVLPIDISSVKSFYYENEEVALNLGTNEEGDINFGEYSIPSLYRKYAIDYGVDSFSGRLDVERLECPENDMIQKFPAEQVEYITTINRTFFSEDANTSPSEDIWLQRNLGPYNKIEFSMFPSEISKKILDCKMDTVFLEMIESKSHFNPTYYTQILDQTARFDEGFRGDPEADEQVVLNDRVSINLRPNEYHNPFVSVDRFINQDLAGDRDLYNFVVNEDEYPLSFYGSELIEEDPTGLRFHMALKTLYQDFDFKDSMDEFTTDRERSFHEILRAEPSYSEVIAYRVEKIETTSGEILQNFYFFNSQNIDRFSFIDKQVITGKKYTYKIYCINAVIGCEYEYSPEVTTTIRERDFGMPSEYRYDLTVKSFKNIKLVETPYYEQEITTALKYDLPPIHPTVRVYRGGTASENNENNFIVEMSSTIGTEVEKPIIIKETDSPIMEETLSKQRSAGIVPRRSEEVKYKSDSLPSHYEMMFLMDPPENFQSFSTAETIIVESSSPLIHIELTPNVERYVVFRAHDQSGISNPTAVFLLENVNNGDGSYLRFERYEMFKFPDDIISFERNISIEPAFNQSIIDFRNLLERLQEDLYNSAPRSETQDPMNLGIEETSIWGEEFIFRFTSEHSGRVFDISVIYDYENVREQEPDYREQEEFSSAICENESAERSAERRRNRDEADRYLDSLHNATITGNQGMPNARDIERPDENPIEEIEIDDEEEILGPGGPRLPEGPGTPGPGRPPGAPPGPPPPLPPDPRRRVPGGGGGSSY